MVAYSRLILLLLFCFGILHSAQAQDKSNEWVMVSFAEVNTASPVIAYATLPVKLADAVVKALPDELKKEAKDDGFDIEAIVAAVDVMPHDEVFEVKQKDFHLKIEKELRAATESAASYMMVKNKYLSLPVPLSFTNAAVSLLQFTYKDLEGKEEELAAMVKELQKMPPGMLFDGKDKLMEEWMTIRLQ